jgi:hypothetical protein
MRPRQVGGANIPLPLHQDAAVRHLGVHDDLGGEAALIVQEFGGHLRQVVHAPEAVGGRTSPLQGPPLRPLDRVAPPTAPGTALQLDDPVDEPDGTGG